MIIRNNKVKGWIVVSDYLQKDNDSVFVWNYTFEPTRSKAIKNFINKTSKDWRWFKRNYNAKCIRCETIYKIKL